MTSFVLFVPVRPWLIHSAPQRWQPNPSPELWHSAAGIKAPLSLQNNPHPPPPSKHRCPAGSVQQPAAIDEFTSGASTTSRAVKALSDWGVNIGATDWSVYLYLQGRNTPCIQAPSSAVTQPAHTFMWPSSNLKNDLPAACPGLYREQTEWPHWALWLGLPSYISHRTMCGGHRYRSPWVSQEKRTAEAPTRCCDQQPVRCRKEKFLSRKLSNHHAMHSARQHWK